MRYVPVKVKRKVTTQIINMSTTWKTADPKPVLKGILYHPNVFLVQIITADTNEFQVIIHPRTTTPSLLRTSRWLKTKPIFRRFLTSLIILFIRTMIKTLSIPTMRILRITIGILKPCRTVPPTPGIIRTFSLIPTTTFKTLITPSVSTPFRTFRTALLTSFVSFHPVTVASTFSFLTSSSTWPFSF